MQAIEEPFHNMTRRGERSIAARALQTAAGPKRGTYLI